MGNSGSGQQQQVTLVEGPPHSWAHSFPRTTSFKVLPDRVPGQRLRLTDNGAILHQGGTISGRKPYVFEPPRLKGYRSNGTQNGEDYRRTLYGSEPDLRYPRESKRHFAALPNHHTQTYCNNNNNDNINNSNSNDNSVKAKIGRSRKKYKAPPAPHVNSADSSSPDSYHRWETSADSSDVTTPSRRSRLFKTRVETKRPSMDNASSKYFQNGYSQMYKPGAVPGRLQRSLSSPQFQDELTAKLRERAVREPPVGKAADSPHQSPVLRGRQNALQSRNSMPQSPHRGADATSRPVGKAIARRVVGNGSDDTTLPAATRNGASKANQSSGQHPPNGYRGRGGRSSREMASKQRTAASASERGPETNGKLTKMLSLQNDLPEKYSRKSTEGKSSESPKQVEKPVATTAAVAVAAAPVKKFYFGMESGARVESLTTGGDTNEVDKFAAALRKSAPVLEDTSPSESFSSEPTNDDSSAGISLKLRPTLPRKQLDIPRFSPTAAWRLLSALESPVHSEEDDLMMLEDRIPHPHIGHHHHHLADKSGDSGISGDASPQHQDSAHNSQVAWTPQQDLEETSSDGGLESAPVSPESIGTAKFSPRFSLSLPREERLSAYPDKVQPDSYPSASFQNLKKLKRSVSGALGRSKEVTAVSSLDENWLLSRSVPNLFDNSYSRRWSDTSPSSGEQDDDQACSLSKPPSFSYLANGGHIMYLPEYKNTSQRERIVPNLAQMSKSCDDLTRHRSEQSTNHVDRSHNVIGAYANGHSGSPSGRPKSSRKFTFQSTIRQIERKRIAEKLSREAEEKEKRRLRELEAMKKVEEEFQRKREREKADIRHQLRLYNLTEGGREQPDGAVVPPPPPSTQILSEFRQPRRDYRDYTPIKLEVDSISHSDSGIKRETVHPEVVYRMPKNAQIYVTPHHSNSGNGGAGCFHSQADSPNSVSLLSDNYRKDFAQGALPRSVASSDSELSQPSTRPTSRTKQRSRSGSPIEDNEVNDDTDCTAQEVNYAQIDDDVDSKEETDEIIPSVETLTKLFTPPEIQISNKITLQPFNRNKTYKPVSFKPFSDKIAQVTS